MTKKKSALVAVPKPAPRSKRAGTPLDTYEHVDADAVVEDRRVEDRRVADDTPYANSATSAAFATTVEADGQIAMMQTHRGDDDAKDALVMHFKSADEVLSTAQALLARAADLRALAKKAREIGRMRESISIEREAAHIGEALLPQVQAQVGLPFNDHEDLLDALTRSVGRTVRNATVRAIHVALSPIEGEDNNSTLARRRVLIDTFETVVGGIAEHAAAAVLPFVHETAERAYVAGLEARNATPQALARQAVQAAAAKQD